MTEAQRIIKEANAIADKAMKRSEWYTPSRLNKFKEWCTEEVTFRNITVLIYTGVLLAFILVEWSLYNG